MYLSSGLSLFLAASIGVLIGVVITFGHRHQDKGSSYKDSPKVDELNSIRINIRQESVIGSLEKLWYFLSESQAAYEKNIKRFDLKNLFADVERKAQFNDLINQLQRSFREDSKVVSLSDRLCAQNRQIGSFLYGFAIVVGLPSYSLLFLVADGLAIVNRTTYDWLWSIPLVLGAGILFVVAKLKFDCRKNLKSYEELKKQYRLEDIWV